MCSAPLEISMSGTQMSAASLPLTSEGWEVAKIRYCGAIFGNWRISLAIGELLVLEGAVRYPAVNFVGELP
jgi:hypothetical protein